MKTIKNLTVTVTYTTGYGDVEVSDKVMRGLEKIQDKHYGKIDFSTPTCENDKDIEAAIDWLRDNIKEEDAYEFEYELVDCE